MTSAVSSTSTPPDWGWNNGLTNPLIATPWPNEGNYFSTNGANDSGVDHWTLAVESESNFGASYPGPADQSFPISNLTDTPGSPEGPVSIGVTSAAPAGVAAGRGSATVEMRTDLYNNTHPGGAGYYTWCAFGLNSALDGGNLPPPNEAEFDANLTYSAYLPNAGAHIAVEYQGWWNNQAFEFAIDLNREGDNWGAASGTLAQNVLSLSGLTFVQLNGAALGLTLIPGVDMSVHINWGAIIQNLVDEGVVPAPVGGWANSAGQDMYVSTELANNSSTQAGITDVLINDFTVSSGSDNTPSTLTQVGGDTMFSLAAGGGQEIDSLTGAIVTTIPMISSATMQFITIDGRQYGTNGASAQTLGLNSGMLCDYNGNNLGAKGNWVDLGLASVQPGAAPSYILVDPDTGRWAEVAVQADGTINYQNYGQNGDTRVVGIYIDPLIALGLVAAGGPDDSQTRFLGDVEANNLSLQGSVYDQQNGGMDLIFSLNDMSGVYLRAILHTDGNIQYANYVTSTQLTQWATKAEIPAALLSGWLAKG